MYDIIIVGSGIAGSYLAEKLKRYKVLVIEKDKKISIKDSGIVSEGIFEFFKGNKLIREKISRMRFVSQNNKIEIEGNIAYILEREDMSEFLRNKIEHKTAFETVKHIECSEGFITAKTDKNEYTAKLLVGADGANSIARNVITDKKPMLALGIMNKTESLDYDCVNVFFNKYYSPDFFAWAIPQSNEYGLMTAVRPMEYYNYFKQKMNLPNGKVRGSFIPIGMTKSYANRILLVGDACGQTKPLTGGGIVFSLKAAQHALDTIKYAFERDQFDEDILKYYEWNWKHDFGAEIKRQLFLRKLYRRMTNRQIDDLFSKFGQHIQQIGDIDYDMPTRMWKKMPKLMLLKALLKFYLQSKF